jgi:hypothetical protein
MQLNSILILLVSIFGAGIGIGLAYYIGGKINKNMRTKSQRVLVFIAMASFGLGTSGFLIELLTPLTIGIKFRYDKLAGYLIANIIFLPALLIFIAKLLNLRKQTSQSTPTPTSINHPSIFNRSQINNDGSDIKDECWGLALIEFENSKDMSLWAKEFAKANGDENKAKANYIKVRAASLSAASIKDQAPQSAYDTSVTIASHKTKETSWNAKFLYKYGLIGLGIIIITAIIANSFDKKNPWEKDPIASPSNPWEKDEIVKKKQSDQTKESKSSNFAIYRKLSDGVVMRWKYDRECFVSLTQNKKTPTESFFTKLNVPLQSNDFLELTQEEELVAVVYYFSPNPKPSIDRDKFLLIDALCAK